MTVRIFLRSMKMISMIGFLPEWYERAEFARYEKMNHDEPL